MLQRLIERIIKLTGVDEPEKHLLLQAPPKARRQPESSPTSLAVLSSTWPLENRIFLSQICSQRRQRPQWEANLEQHLLLAQNRKWHNKDEWKLAFHHGKEKTSFLNNSRRQLCENLPASVSVALKYAIRASRAFSCVGALESATAFLNRGPTTQQEEN
jgi:hypothetical protein